MQSLNWAYEKALSGAPGLDSSEEMAASYMRGSESLIDKANSLIRWQNTKAGTSGFLTGLGGILALPITIPANMASVIYIQIRMITALAKMGGYNIKDDQVKTLVYVCLAGEAGKDILKDAGIIIGTKLATNAVKNISGKTITLINQKVGFKLLTKFGEKGIINLGKTIPILGGVIGGTMDAASTNLVGNIARDTFIGKYKINEVITTSKKL